jgi:oxygen-independent coproporphyrinogen-3 oxidase
LSNTNATAAVYEITNHPWFLARRNEYLRWYPKTLGLPSTAQEWTTGPVHGAYIHVPFCDKICRFCPFNKRLTDPELVQSYVQGLLLECKLWHERVGHGPLEFVYFGGGTPSVLSASQINSILECLHTTFGLQDAVEISLETHPTHASTDRIRAFVSAGVNRISLGIQAFNDAALTRLGATHVAADSHKAVRAVSTVMDNFAIDLLYAYDKQSLNDWQQDVDITLDEYRVPHLSCYALVPIDSDCLPLSQEHEVELAVFALSVAETKGMEHYASCASGGFDVALPGHKCKYEHGHWSAPQRTFLGLGPGAFGFVGGHTTVNGLAIDKYSARVESGSLPLISAVPVAPQELKHRYFALGVKTLAVPFAPYREQFRSDPRTDFGQQFHELERQRMATVDRDSLKLSSLGRLFVDSCSALFFSNDERAVPHPEEPEIRSLEKTVYIQ